MNVYIACFILGVLQSLLNDKVDTSAMEFKRTVKIMTYLVLGILRGCLVLLIIYIASLVGFITI